GKLGTAPRGARIDALSPWELADSLAYYYADDAEVSREVDRTLKKALGDTPLAAAVSVDGGGQAVADLLLESRDPARDLAWALIGTSAEGAGELASALVKTIIAEFDQADARARETEAALPEEVPPEPPPPAAEKLPADAAKEAARAQRARERTLKRLGGLKERLGE